MIKKCILVFMCITFNYCPILIELEFSRQNLQRSSNIKFHENPSNGSRGGQTERHDETNSRVHNSANAPKYLKGEN